MKPRPEPAEYITLEGEDYNLVRRAEALAREEFCRPENRERRLRHIKTLFPDVDPSSLRAAPLDFADPPVVL